MRLVSVIVAAVLATGCDYVPGTPWHSIREGREQAAAVLIDPSSAQFRNERAGPDGAVCGEINGKNRMGAYVGFTRFVVVDEQAFLEGHSTWTQADFDEEMAEAREAMSRRYGGSSARYHLDRAREINEELQLASAFESLWDVSCGTQDGADAAPAAPSAEPAGPSG